MKKIQELNDILTDDEFEMLLNSVIQEKSDRIKMKCNRCGVEMELDSDILSELAESDGKISCVCMECSLGTMYLVE